jgi:hypothetical protein
MLIVPSVCDEPFGIPAVEAMAAGLPVIASAAGGLTESVKDGESGVLVYLLAGTTKAKVAVFGKHYRALVATGSNQVTYLKELTKSVLEVPLEENGQSPVALTVTHLVTEYPLETHVFTSLLLDLPVYVATSRGMWRVNGDQIAFLGASS